MVASYLAKQQLTAPTAHESKLGSWDLWRSLPRPCKLFLVVCVIQAVTAGAFASRQLAKGGINTLQDLTLILISAALFLFLVLDAFWLENGYQLLVCMASGGLNLLQLIIYGTALSTRDATSVGVVIVCAALQAIAVALARWAYLGFGWRMYSKIACDATLPNAELRRAIGLRLDRFTALAKFDAHLLILLLIVGLVNGVNPLLWGQDVLVPLIILAVVGVPTATLWLVMCWVSIIGSKRRLQLVSEFTFPICYIVGAAYMFSSVYYGHRLHQLHGEMYLIMYPILFIIGRTGVWWDARLLHNCDIVQSRKDFATAQKRSSDGSLHSSGPPIPPELLPLVHGAWLLKLPSNGSAGQQQSNKSLSSFMARLGFASHRGRWRYFQLSHDGSTLRWDWRKYVLMVHVEAVRCRVEDCSITLSLTLEPDLRLKFNSPEQHATWARGLTLLVTLLGNPDGLEGKADALKLHHRKVGMDSIDGMIKVPPRIPRPSLGEEGSGIGVGTPGSGQGTGKGHGGSVGDPGSPSRLLARLTSASSRPSAAGLVTKEALEAAAWQARRALGETFDEMVGEESQDVQSPRHYQWDVEKGHASTQTSPGGDTLRQRTPKHSAKHATTPSWLRRTLTAPSSALLEDSTHVLQLPSHTPEKPSQLGLVQPSRFARQYGSTRDERHHERSLSMDGHRPPPCVLNATHNVSEDRGNMGGGEGGSYVINVTAGTLPAVGYPRYVGPHFLHRTSSVPINQATQSFHDAHLRQENHRRKTLSPAGMSGLGPTSSVPSLARDESITSSMVSGVIMNIEMIDFQQLTFGRMLGQGAEGPVYAAWYQETPVAVKRASCQMEVDLHVHAGWHDNVVNLRGLAYHGGHTYLVMELCPRGTLDLLIHSQGGASKMDPCKLLPIVRSIARGMLHLHTRSPPILHRDLKPANIFIGHGYVMKIGDFGMARYGCDTRAYRAAMAPRPPPFDETAIKSFSKTNMVPGPTLMRTLTPGVIGTAAYSAPELLNPDSPPDQPLDNHGDGDDGGGGCAALHEDQQEFDTEKLLKADVYAFGVLLWELMERQRPHAGMDGFQVQTQWVLEPASMKLRPPRVPEGLPPQQKQIMEALSSLVMQCTAWDPEIRPSFKRILSILKEASKQDAEQQLHGQQLASPF